MANCMNTPHKAKKKNNRTFQHVNPVSKYNQIITKIILIITKDMKIKNKNL